MSENYLEANQIRAERPAGAIQPRVTVEGRQCILSAQIKRIFPLSHPSSFVCIQDGAGKEIGILRSMDGLDESTMEIFSEELDRRYFTPVIKQIHDLRQEAGMWHFLVDTQRGPTEFYVRNWRDNAYEITANRWQIHSVDGGRFDIPNLEALDARSQRLLSRLL